MHECDYVSVCVCGGGTCKWVQVLVEARGIWFPWSWSYRRLWATLHGCGKFRFSARAVCKLSCWIVSLARHLPSPVCVERILITFTLRLLYLPVFPSHAHGRFWIFKYKLFCREICPFKLYFLQVKSYSNTENVGLLHSQVTKRKTSKV